MSGLSGIRTPGLSRFVRGPVCLPSGLRSDLPSKERGRMVLFAQERCGYYKDRDPPKVRGRPVGRDGFTSPEEPKGVIGVPAEEGR